MRSWCGVGAGVMAPVSPIGGDGLRHESSAADKEMPEELRRLAALSCLKDDTMPPPGLLAKLRHGVACFYPELPWGSPPAWKESGHPTTGWLVTWEIVTCLAVIWVGATLPYASFFDGSKHREHQFLFCALSKSGTWPPTAQSTWAGVDILCDCLFFLDLGIGHRHTFSCLGFCAAFLIFPTLYVLWFVMTFKAHHRDDSRNITISQITNPIRTGAAL